MRASLTRPARPSARNRAGLGRVGLDLLGGVLLVLVATARVASAGELDDWVRGLADPDPSARRAAYRELVRRRDPQALPRIRRAIDAYDVQGQYWAALVLDAYPWEAVESTWQKLRAAAAPYVRFSASNALVRHGREDAAEGLAEALTDATATPTVRLWMVSRLTRDPPPPVLEALRSLLASGQDPRVVQAVLARLHVRRDRAGMVRATRLLDDPRPAVRSLAAAFLLRMGDEHRAEVLAEGIRGGLAPPALDLVEELLDQTSRVPTVVFEAATERLGQEDKPYLLVRWIEFAARFRCLSARPQLKRLLQGADLVVARAAFDALVSMAGPVTSDTLRPLLGDEDFDRRLWAANALRRQDDDAGLAFVILVLQRGSDAQRAEAARLLGSFRQEACVESLLDAMADPHAGVRHEAGGSLEWVLKGLFPYRTFSLARTGWAPNAPEAARGSAIAQVRRWWRDNRTADW